LFSFITNFLEPVAFLFYLAALLIYCRHHKTLSARQLSFYYFLIALLQLYSSIQVNLNEQGNIWVYDVVSILTSVFIGNYFYRLLQTPVKKKTVIILVLAFLVYAIYRQVTVEGQRLFDSLGYAIVSASVAVYVFMYFHQVLKNVNEANILKEFNFWLASGYLVYFVGSFIIFVSYYYLTNKIIQTYTRAERDVLTALWGLHNVLLFLGAISLLIGSLWVTYRKRSV
jgi:predicted membrane protein